MKETRVIDRGCYERGCACHDDRVDTDGVIVLMEVAMNQMQQPEVTEEEEQEWKMRELDAQCNGLSHADMVKTTPRADDVQVGGTHYKDLDPQPWAVMQALLTPEEYRGFLKGNMIKYAMRQGKKDSPDAGKYWHYKTKLDEMTAGEPWI